jgi:ParB family chromosome partitioning protein
MEEHARPRAGEPHQQDDQVGIRRRLGRGLNALLGGDVVVEEPLSTDSTAQVPSSSQSYSTQIHVDLVERNPFQPRKEFETEAIEELTASIRQHGVLQPILVRTVADQYQIIAGERRWLAAKHAGLETVPCRILELEDQQVCEVAIEENLKRKDLNVLEKAQAFQDYISRFDSTMEELAKRLSMNRSTLSNYLRLLELPDFVKQMLLNSKISSGHARALLSLDEANQIALCKQIDSAGLSVRKTEQAVRSILRQDDVVGEPEPETIPFPAAGEKKPATEMTNHVRSLQDQLCNLLGVKVEIRVSGEQSGKIVIPFHSNDEFEHLVRQFRRATA